PNVVVQEPPRRGDLAFQSLIGRAQTLRKLGFREEALVWSFADPVCLFPSPQLDAILPKKHVSSTSRGFCTTGGRRHRVYLIRISENQLLGSLFEPNHVPASVLSRAKLIDDHRVVLLINEILQFLLQAFESSRGDVTFKNRILDPV